MTLTSYLSRDEQITSLKIAKEKFAIFNIIDSCYLDSTVRSVLAVVSSNDTHYVPYCYALLKSSFFINQLNKRQSYVLIIKNKEYELIDEKNNAYILGDNIKKQIKDNINLLLSSYGSLNEKGEQILTPSYFEIGPHFDVNLLLGNRFKSDEPLLTTPKAVVNSKGGGSFRGKANFQVLATRWDIQAEENGNPFNRQFYLVENGKIIFYSGSKNATKCIHKNNRSEFYYDEDDLNIKRTIFILPQKKGLPEAIEAQLIDITNKLDTARNLSLVYTGMFGSPSPDAQKEDVVYQSIITESRVLRDEKHNIVAVSPSYKLQKLNEEARFASLRNEEGFASSYSSSYASFIGRGTIENPEGINSFYSEPCKSAASFFALRKDINLKEKATTYIDTFVGAVYKDEDKSINETLNTKVEALFDLCKDRSSTLVLLNEVINSFKKYSSFYKVECEDKNFESYINNNLPFQVLYQSFVSRSFAQTQKGYREIGFREIQDLYASIPYLASCGNIKLSKSLLKKWIENVYEFGYVNHNFYYVGKEAGMCSDDGLWLLHAVYTYIKNTNDSNILYSKFKIASNNKSRMLIDTLKAIVTYSSKISVGVHHLPLLDTADWNDCLRVDSSPLSGGDKEKIYKKLIKKNNLEFGSTIPFDKPESVMNAFLLVIALKEFISFLDDKKEKDEWNNVLKDLSSNIKTYAYKYDYFARVLLPLLYKNKIDYIGSKGDGLSSKDEIDGTYYLNSFSWSLLSDIASEEEIKKMLNTVDKYLRTKEGYILCSPSDLSKVGTTSSSTDHYYEGDRENGGVFKHATMMFVVALLKRSKTIKDIELRTKMLDDAFFMVNKVLPYKVLDNVFINKGNPRFCTQYINSKTGEHIGPILSGTATWLTLAVFEMFGINNSLANITPVLDKEIDKITLNTFVDKKKVELTILKNKGSYIDYSKKKEIIKNDNGITKVVIDYR